MEREYPASQNRNIAEKEVLSEQGIAAFRQYFPCGLVQPVGAYRFSEDALSLARAALEALPCAADRTVRVAELGTGCGVVGLALLLWGKESLIGLGVEREPELVAAARENAVRLGLEYRFDVFEGDIATLDLGGRLHSGSHDLVVANPPWRRAGTCRVSPSPLRRAALIGDDTTFSVFANAAKSLLRAGGLFVVSTGTDRLADMEKAVWDAGMTVERVVRTHRKFAFVVSRAVRE